MDRTSICFPRWGTQNVTLQGDQDFQSNLRRWYSPEESNALERLVLLKARLPRLPTHDFWTEVTEGISSILHAEIAFVMKRVLVDDTDLAVEMPPLGEPGSCLMAAAFHYCANDGSKSTSQSLRFHGHACPCSHMRHDKVFVIPEDFQGFITHNPNKLPIEADAYMAVPLFLEGKCVAHFGAMWSKQKSPSSRLSWGFVEMLLHALEDSIGQRIQDGSDSLRASPTPLQRVIPHTAITGAQSLKPYAGSLSHELRTPMQGVVGMLDIMHATVQEALLSNHDPQLRDIFETLKENVEIVQDSSRRAVVAADNVIQAYDTDTTVPYRPANLSLESSIDSTPPSPSSRQDDRIDAIAVDADPPHANHSKRRRSETASESPSKLARLESATSSEPRTSVSASQHVRDGLLEAEVVAADRQDGQFTTERRASRPSTPAIARTTSSESVTKPSSRPAHVRAMLQYVIKEGLKVGGRPDSVTATDTALGEMLEVRTKASDGTFLLKLIEWSVDANLPETLSIDEKELSKLVSCVVLNAIKFTGQDGGRVRIRARLGLKARSLTIKIVDNGPGIPAAFLPRLFTPFSQEDGSLTRPSDGLGLGLMVAKGIARKLGGDLLCVRAETRVPHSGCEFEIKLPIVTEAGPRRSPSPVASTTPSRREESIHSDSRSISLGAERSNGHPGQTSRPLDPSDNTAGSGPSRTELTTEISSPKSSSDDRQQVPGTLPPASETRKVNRINGCAAPGAKETIDRDLANKYPLTFLVAEDNKINRRLLVSMLAKLGYRIVVEAHDGAEAVRQMSHRLANNERIDVVLMDLWMPLMDGYEATRRILDMDPGGAVAPGPTVLAVTADVTDGALDRAAQVGMKGFMTKPYKLHDLQRLITEYALAPQRSQLPG